MTAVLVGFSQLGLQDMKLWLCRALVVATTWGAQPRLILGILGSKQPLLWTVSLAILSAYSIHI